MIRPHPADDPRLGEIDSPYLAQLYALAKMQEVLNDAIDGIYMRELDNVFTPAEAAMRDAEHAANRLRRQVSVLTSELRAERSEVEAWRALYHRSSPEHAIPWFPQEV